jgi:hypothetical protein
MKKLIVLCSLMVFCSAGKIQAQCYGILTGKGCAGDTLTAVFTSNVDHFSWVCNGQKIKTLSHLYYLPYAFTVAGQSDCHSGSDSAHLSQVASIRVDAAGNVYVGSRVGWVYPNNVSSVYQIFNNATSSLDTVFG